jgi:hypothetical protein
MSDLNWRNKYDSLKAKFHDSVDVAFRLGFEAGSQQAQQQAASDQAAQAQAQAAAMQGGAPGQPGQPGQGQPAGPPGGIASEPPNGEEQAQPQQEPTEDPNAGSELDQHIGQLESMVAKGDMSPSDLMKAIKDLKGLRSKPKPAPKSLQLSHRASHNMSEQQKASVNMQQDIVKSVMDSWKKEEERASNDIRSILAREGLYKSED